MTEKTERPSAGGHLRKLGVTVLVVLATMSFLTASLGYWAHRNLLNTTVWVERVGPLASDPAVQTAVEDQLTKQIMTVVNPQKLIANALPKRAKVLAVPLSGAVESFVANQVAKYVESPEFEKAWVELNRRAHKNTVAVLRGQTPTEAIDVTRGQVVVNLIPAIDAVLAHIAEASPTVFGHTINLPKIAVNQIPADARQQIATALGVTVGPDFGTFVVYNGDSLHTAQNGLKLFDRLLVVAIVLTVVFTVAALALTRRHRRTALQLLAGFAIMTVLVRRIAKVLINQVDHIAKVPENQAAISVILRAFTDPLLRNSGYILIAFGVAMLALVLTGPYRWAVGLRASTVRAAQGGVKAAKGGVAAATDLAQQESTVTWVQAHATQLQWGGGIAFVLGLWFWNLGFLGLVLLAAVVGLFELWVSRVQAAATTPQA